MRCLCAYACVPVNGSSMVQYGGRWWRRRSVGVGSAWPHQLFLRRVYNDQHQASVPLSFDRVRALSCSACRLSASTFGFRLPSHPLKSIWCQTAHARETASAKRTGDGVTPDSKCPKCHASRPHGRHGGLMRLSYGGLVGGLGRGRHARRRHAPQARYSPPSRRTRP